MLLALTPAASLAAEPLHLPWRCGEGYTISQGHQTGSHKGFGEWAWDADMPVGSVVTAPAAGVVRAARDDSHKGGCSSTFAHDGNYAIISFEDGTEVLLLHLAPGSLVVEPGQRVRAGDVIGKIGMTGWTCGAHLHFQLQETCASWWCQSLPAQIVGVGDPAPGTTHVSESCPGTGEGLISAVQTPARIDRGQASVEVMVRVKNTSAERWTPERIALVSAGPNTLGWELPDGSLCPAVEGCALPISAVVGPGQELEQSWRVAPSTQRGTRHDTLAFRVARLDGGAWAPLSAMEISVIPLCDAGQPCAPAVASSHTFDNPAPRAEGGCASAQPTAGWPAGWSLWALVLAMATLFRRRRCI